MIHPYIAGGLSVSGIALILQATHKCVFYWPVSHAFVTKPRSSVTKTKPPLCKGRWHGDGVPRSEVTSFGGSRLAVTEGL